MINKNNNSKKYISQIIDSRYIDQWFKKESKGSDNILISSPTGTGKTTFVIEELKSYKVLYICNRIALKRQILSELESKKIDNITVITYQYLENIDELHKQYGLDINIDEYDILVLDEVHYFVYDYNFNEKVSNSWNILFEKHKHKKKIMISATVDFLEKTDLFDIGKKIYLYGDDEKKGYWSNYKFFEFNSNMTTAFIIKTILQRKEKVIIFCTNRQYDNIKKECKQFDIKLPKHINSKEINSYIKKEKELDEINFICKFYNPEIQQMLDDKYDSIRNELYNNEHYINYKNIIEKNEFNGDILMTTKLLDNGVSLNYFSENKPVKNIIIYDTDIETIIQEIGRVRLKDKEEVKVYINKNSKNKLEKYINDLMDRKSNYELLSSGKLDEFINKVKLSNIQEPYYKLDILDNGELVVKLNEYTINIYQKYIEYLKEVLNYMEINNLDSLSKYISKKHYGQEIELIDTKYIKNLISNEKKYNTLKDIKLKTKDKKDIENNLRKKDNFPIRSNGIYKNIRNIIIQYYNFKKFNVDEFNFILQNNEIKYKLERLENKNAYRVYKL